MSNGLVASRSIRILKHLFDVNHMRNICEVHIGELDLWQDYISAPLNAFNFGERLADLSVTFSRLTCLTIRIVKWSIEELADARFSPGNCWQ
jgi:hypothetical protein